MRPGRSSRRSRRQRRFRLRFNRLLAFSILVLLGLGGLAFRLGWVQVARHGALAEAAVLQRAQTIPLRPTRGRILDRHGLPLSDGLFTYRVAVYPAVLGETGPGLGGLASALGQTRSALRDRLAAGKGAPVFVAGGLDAAEAALVMALGLEGVVVVTDEERYGPGAVARHAVGYLIGQTGADGLEKAWDSYLGGKGPELLALFVDGRGQPLAGLGWRKISVTGGASPWTSLPCDLVTTIDLGVQTAVEDALRAAGATRGTAVVLDPRTGDVLAMASRPVFDQGGVAASLERGDAPLINRAISAFPPGSVIKPLVLGAALEDGIVTPGAEFACEGRADVGGRAVTCTAQSRGGHGEMTVEQALAASCNVVFAEIGWSLGQDELRTWLGRFGLGQPTGVGLPGEAAGTLPPGVAESPEPEAAFGQGSLTVTPLQLALAYSVIANGGRLPACRLAVELEAPIGARAFVSRRPAAGASSDVSVVSGRSSRRVLSASTAAAVTAGLARAAATGTGIAAAVTRDVAGKTGTAETGRVGPGGQELYDGWFAGFWPSYDPRYVIVVLIEDTPIGGGAAAAVFGNILEGILEKGQTSRD